MKSIKLIVVLVALFSTTVFAMSKDYVVQNSSIQGVLSAQVISINKDTVSLNLSVVTVVPHCQGMVLTNFTEVDGDQVKLLEVVKLHAQPKPEIIIGPNGEEIRRIQRVCTTVLITKSQILNFSVEFDPTKNEMVVDVKGNYRSSQVKLIRDFRGVQAIRAEVL